MLLKRIFAYLLAASVNIYSQTSISGSFHVTGYFEYGNNAPTEFKSLYSFMNQRMNAWSASLGSPAHYSDLRIGVECYPCASYQSITNSTYMTGTVLKYIDAMHTLGVRAMKFQLPAPMLVPDWWTFYCASHGCSAATQLANYQAAYQTIINYIVAYGIRLSIQSVTTTIGSTGSGGDPLDTEDWFISLCGGACSGGNLDTQFTAYKGYRVQNVNAVAVLIENAGCTASCSITFSAEPDNECLKSGIARCQSTDGSFLTNIEDLINSISDSLFTNHPTVVRVAGVGSYQAASNVLSQAHTNGTIRHLNRLQVHMHTIGFQSITDAAQNANTLAQAAVDAGMGCEGNEQWPYYVLTAGSEDPATTEAKNPFSFWHPIDIQFMDNTVKWGNKYHCSLVSFSFANVMLARNSYTSTSGCATPPWTVCTPSQWQSKLNTQVVSSITAATPFFSRVGHHLRELIDAQ